MKRESAKEIHIDNIREFSQRSEISDTQRALSVSELTSLFLEDAVTDNDKGLYVKFVRALGKNALPADKALFCKRLSLLRQGERKEVSENRDSTAAGAHGKVAIVRNRYNEEAFSVFSKTILRPKSVYATSFNQACEAVIDGECEFCVLPVEDSHGGKLFGFYSMLDRYELKICSSYSIETDEDAESVKYALVGKKSPDRLPKSAGWVLECSVISDDGRFPADIIEVSHIFEAKLSKIDSMPVEYDDVRQKYYFSFELQRKNALAFDLYLSVEQPRYSQIGIYPRLK